MNCDPLSSDDGLTLLGHQDQGFFPHQELPTLIIEGVSVWFHVLMAPTLMSRSAIMPFPLPGRSRTINAGPFSCSSCGMNGIGIRAQYSEQIKAVMQVTMNALRVHKGQARRGF